MTQPIQRTIRIGAAVVAGLAVGVAGLGAYAWTKRVPAGQPATVAGGAVLVTVTGKGCEPGAVSVPAGRVTFQIANRSERALEWEILDGVMVVDERENIAPGLSQRLATRLEPGEYAITCGLLSNPRGRLTVTPETADQGNRRPNLVALVGPMAEYKVFVTLGAMDLADTTDSLAEAVRTGDRDAALASLAEAHAAYERIRPATKMLFADLDTALDSTAADFAGGENDPAFTGFRRLAVGLAESPSDIRSLGALADRLNADVHTLRDRLADASILPARMVAGASLLLGDVAAAGRTSDTVVIGANIDGAEKVVELLRPLTRKADHAASDRLDASLAAARHSLSGPQPLDRRPLQALAAELVAWRDTLGLDG